MPSKQDRNGVRTASDVERRHKLSLIEPTAEEVNKLKDDIVVDTQLSATSTHPLENRVITQNLNNKVTKESGKELSSNDFTNTYKNKLDGIDDNANNYTLPTATNEELGGVKIDGLTININDGVINAMQPIGTVYLSINNTDPSSLLGGTWVSIGTITLNETVYAFKKTN